jgi:hypothetical protein
MYIRRKAFSVAIDENGEEKLFSTTEIMSEESYLEKLYSENEEQKEFASVRAMKKQSKALIDAVSKKDIKGAGKISARINKQGLNKNSEKFLASEGSKKVYKGQVNKLAEIGGTKPSKAMKNLAVEELTTGAVNLGKQNIARGGKAIKLKR